MPKPPVVVANPFQFKIMSVSNAIARPFLQGVIVLLLCLSAASSNFLIANELSESQPLDSVPGYLARINLNDPVEVEAIFRRAENYYHRSGLPNTVPPVVVVLHGPEIDIFVKSNYSRYQSIVDLAAKLSAFDVLDVRICETRMSRDNIQKGDLFPFVGTVPFGPTEIDRLLDEEDYVIF